MVNYNPGGEGSFRVKHSLTLFATAAIWGSAFVFQSLGMRYVGPFTFNAVRFALGALTLVPVILFRKKARQRSSLYTFRGQRFKGAILTGGSRTFWKAAVMCGCALCAASSFQQFGIAGTTVGKAGFITALYIVFVPVVGIFVGRKAGPVVWICIGIAIAGLYFLCLTGDEFTLQSGDTLCLLCAVLFSVQILLVDHYAPLVDGICLAGAEFIVTSFISFVMMLMFEHSRWSALRGAAIPVLYVGVLSSGVAYTLQIIGQRGLDPAYASLIMSMESAISAILGWLILHQSMTGREILGCVIMAVSIVISQLYRSS